MQVNNPHMFNDRMGACLLYPFNKLSSDSVSGRRIEISGILLPPVPTQLSWGCATTLRKCSGVGNYLAGQLNVEAGPNLGRYSPAEEWNRPS